MVYLRLVDVRKVSFAECLEDFFSSLQSLDFLNANESQVGEGTAMSCPFSFPVCQ